MSSRDIVIDADFMTLLNRPPDAQHARFLSWLRDTGSLAVSVKLLNEYKGSGSPLIAALIDQLLQGGRLNHVRTSDLKAFKADNHYGYTCNGKDRWHAKLVFLSNRKKLLSLDKRLVHDVSHFRKVAGVQPQAMTTPIPVFYL